MFSVLHGLKCFQFFTPLPLLLNQDLLFEIKGKIMTNQQQPFQIIIFFNQFIKTIVLFLIPVYLVVFMGDH